MNDQSVNEAYFAEMYAGDPDPWGFETRWYEARKQALTMAALPRARYRSAFEPGCSVGVLSAQLVRRCDRVLACDLIEEPLHRARQRLAGSTARIERWDIHSTWPEESFDLIVLSEIVYYLEATAATEFARQAAEHLDPDGHLVSVHWRHAVAEYPLSGDEADRIVADAPGLHRLGGYADADFVLSVLGRQQLSVAQTEDLA